jgi:hypothetical protein
VKVGRKAGLARLAGLLAAAALLAGAGWELRGRIVSRARAAPAPAAGRSPASLRFADITAGSGVAFRHDRASAGRKYFVETMGAGVAMIDYDNDGLQDLFFVNGAPLPGYRPPGPMLPALYHNLGGGRFQEVTRQAGLAVQMYGMGCAVGDFDNDGFDDLFVTAVLGPSRLFRNLGSGKFADVTASAGLPLDHRFATSAAWLDYDRDGNLDLFVCNYVRYRTVKDDLPCYFKEHIRSYCIPFAYDPAPSSLYHNDGHGHFTDVSRSSGIASSPGKSLAVGIFDFDRDSWPDILVANDTTPTHLFRNNRDGTFSETAPAMGIAYGPSGAAKAGMGVDVADDRNDGRVSVAMGNFSSEMAGYYQQTDGGFFDERSVAAGIGEPSRQFLTFGTLFLDLDNDGWKDLFLANGHVQDNVGLFHSDVSYEQRPLLYRNLGGAHYREVASEAGPPLTVPIVARGAARGDLDNDGRLDLVVTTNNGPAHLWRNVVEPVGHWIEIRLRGVRSNRNGFGSQLAITAGGMRQTAELESGSSYLSQSDQRVHFGTGAASRIDRLEIRWPGGAVDVLTGVQTDRTITVTEGQSPAPARATNH